MRQWIVTFGGCGKIPGAPGTAGSFATAGIILLAHTAWRSLSLGSPLVFHAFIIALMLGACTAAVSLGSWAIAFYGRKDPGPFVLDEVGGVCLTMLGLPLRADWRELWVVLIAFAAFRVFDILKPPPCRQLEKLPAGWGILMDDLMAGVYANLLCQLVIRLLM